MAHDVFISYSTHDRVLADAVCAGLEGQQLRCWVAPRDIHGGANWGESIIDAITGIRAFVLLLLGAANESQQVMREVERAASKGIPIIPVRLEDGVPSKSLEYYLSATHWLDAMTPPVEAHIGRLATAVRAVIDITAPPSPHAAVGHVPSVAQPAFMDAPPKEIATLTSIRSKTHVKKGLLHDRNKTAHIGFYFSFGATLGFLLLIGGLVFSVPGAVLGILGFKAYRRDPSRGGRGHAWAAIVMGSLVTTWQLCWIVVAILRDVGSS
ncbi:MAG: hypothetical protein DHS20C14_11870 [Phycisphaeraceae bacterium]|nr:MAG: hypothetical protein DHS20C14_11870 [Phycisphaeraceae bacterium]